MKKRIFYIINLDNRRIAFLSVILTGILAIAYATGYRMGRSNPEIPESNLSGLQIEKSNIADSHTDLDNIVQENSDEKNIAFKGIPLPEPENTTSLKSSEKVNIAQADKASIDNRSTSESTSPKPLKRETGPDKKRESAAKKPVNPRTAVLNESGSIKLSDISPSASSSNKRNNKTSPPANAANERQKFYSFQMGAFKSEKAAERLLLSLKQDGFAPYIKKTGNLVVVRVGKSSARKGLWSLEAKLKKNDYSYFLISD